ncbi:MAG: FtsX-like permease family protein [Anaerolineae bacterium]|nr:FtsX-like permease family protein [Anaerolineae bacterium]
MVNTRWYKVFNDLTGNKTRTLLIVLSIAVGLFAVGTIVSARTILSTEMDRSYAAINPSSGIVRTSETFDEDFVRSVRAMPEVADVDARRTLDARVKVVGQLKVAGDSANENLSNSNDIGGTESTEKTLRIFAVRDYDAMRVDTISPILNSSGESIWPPPEREILIERAALSLLHAQIGDYLRVELPGDRERMLRIAGLAHDMVQVPAQFDGTPYGYIAFETLAWFGEPHGYNELHIIAEPSPGTVTDSKEHVRAVVNAVKDKAEHNGLTIPLAMTAEPGMLPLDDILQAVLLLMGTLGLLSLFLSVFLIINTISALLTQQKRQIGVMKAIGARTGQIMGMYLVMVLLYGLLALLIAAPLSVIGARELSRFLAGMFNFDLMNVQTPPAAIFIQVAVGLLVPVLASLPSFLANLQITAAEAMRVGYRLGKGRFGKGIIDRLLAGANLWFARRVLLRPLLLSIRNTFRSKGRLALTLITLTLGGAIFIGVFSVQASLDQTLDDLLRWWGFDTIIYLTHPYRAEKVTQTALEVPGVSTADTWFQLPVRRVRENGTESNVIYFFVPHPDSDLVPSPAITEGRWLLPEDENAVVLSTLTLKEEPDIRVGDNIILKIMGRERDFRVVGICLGIMTPMGYAPYHYISRMTGQAGLAGAALVKMEHRDADFVAATNIILESQFERAGLRVSDLQTLNGERNEANASFGIIVTLLMVMAVLLAIVGGLGLMGTMSINVLERTREIGVLRAIGAPNRGVARVFIIEGIAIGVMSWGLGAILAVPLGKLLSDAVGLPLMGTPLTFSYSVLGVWVWLAVVVILSALASFIPARNASRLTVREVLAYE